MPHSTRRALVVNDEGPSRELLRLHLCAAGFDVETVADGRTALRIGRARAFDLLVLDLTLPGLDGVSLCKAIRADSANQTSPILMVTARDAESDKVIALESGADDYVTKPFGVRELMARIEALLRRHRRWSDAEAAASMCASPPQIYLDLERREAHVRGHAVDLTRQEFDLLHRLAARPGIVFSRGALLQNVWSDKKYVTERTVDAVISRLRKKIEHDPRDPELLLTAWGIGYKFAAAE